MNYLTDRGYEFNSSIIEYDIKHANINLMKYYNLYPDIKKLDRLDAMEKGKREKEVGLMQRADPELAKKLERAFNDIVTEFMQVNNLSKEDDVISIKKDIAGNIISTEVFDIYFDGNKYFVCATFQCDENILGSDINNAWNDTKQTVPYMTQNGNISFRDEGTTFHIECSTDRLAGLTEFYDRLIATSEKSSSPILSWDY